MNSTPISIIYPTFEEAKFKTLSPTTVHDLALDAITQALTSDPNEQQLILTVLSKMTDDVSLARFRADVFEDILKLPTLRKEMMELLDRVKFLQDFSSIKKDLDTKADMWDLLHRLEEINDYIVCVEAIQDCLAKHPIQSEGLLNLKASVEAIYQEASFKELKTDIDGLKANTSNLKSITVGINLNERFEAVQAGLISVNNKPFKQSTIVQHFSKALGNSLAVTKGSALAGIHEGTDWDGDMHFDESTGTGLDGAINAAQTLGLMRNPLAMMYVKQSSEKTMINMVEGDYSQGATRLMDKAVSQLLGTMVKQLREVLSKYVSLSIYSITDLIPEFMYYIRFAELVEKLMAEGYGFCKPQAAPLTEFIEVSKAGNTLHDAGATDKAGAGIAPAGTTGDAGTALAAGAGTAPLMQARGLWNLKLATSHGAASPQEVVVNDLDFDASHLVYILTGANRGGKTTLTQAIGILYVLAQGGIYVPASRFFYVPVDAVYTHFPADEDKTLDLGRLGEECARFKEMYTQVTGKSLLLLNETFSTTSFEEGYFIATDAVKAILAKRMRTIYNTHMHKLGFDVDALNEAAAGLAGAGTEAGTTGAGAGDSLYDAGTTLAGTVRVGELVEPPAQPALPYARAASLIMQSTNGERSFKVSLAPPEGQSYASDIAKKYGVTLEMLLEHQGEPHV